MNFLESLIGIIRWCWDRIAPFEVVDQYEGAVVLRLGKFDRTLDPGFHWIIPLFEKVLKCPTVVQTINLPSQTITTKCGRSIVASAVVKYEVKDAKAFQLDVWSVKDAISDVGLGAIQGQLSNLTWDAIRQKEITVDVTRAVRDEVAKFGVKIHRVTLSDLGFVRSIRLLQDQTTKDTTGN